MKPGRICILFFMAFCGLCVAGKPQPSKYATNFALEPTIAVHKAVPLDASRAQITGVIGSDDLRSICLAMARIPKFSKLPIAAVETVWPDYTTMAEVTLPSHIVYCLKTLEGYWLVARDIRVSHCDGSPFSPIEANPPPPVPNPSILRYNIGAPPEGYMGATVRQLLHPTISKEKAVPLNAAAALLPDELEAEDLAALCRVLARIPLFAGTDVLSIQTAYYNRRVMAARIELSPGRT